MKTNKYQIVYILLVLICFSTVRAQLRPPRITENPDSVVVKKHEPATLNCKADGKPTPTIEWYKDNELVHNTANRMVLPSGSLFFLHVIHNKRDGDTGVYYCLAKNEVGKTKSRNASLDVALLRDEFKIMPKNVRVAAGETAVMECAPPRGFPEPIISWKRNGEKLNTGTGRIRLGGSNLMISEVRPGDEGRYQCIAENLVGVRESPPALLNVQVKPFFIRGPEDVTALSSEHIEFHCKVGGDPTPTITWRRQDGKMPIGRAQILEDKALKIIHVTPADEGVYICEVENPVGTITSSATLIVHSRPTFLVTPKDIRVPVNNVAKLECVATGNPPPSVFWTREGNQVLMFPGKIHGRFSVSSEGALTISGVRKEDRGYYVCSALSVVGSSMAKAYLTVSAIADVPPPIIRLGAANQTLPQDTVALLPCEALGTPQPVIKWLFNNRPVPLHEPRFVVVDSGTLQINDLKNYDSGAYTCIASSESGETSWSSSLTVESPRNPNIMFHRMPDPSTFPGPPLKPSIVNMTETSVTISWRRLGRPGSSPFIGSTIEYYSPDLQTGWTVAAKRINSDIYTVNNLQPDSRYIFFVRTENSHGLGPPSPISDEIRTLGSPSSQILPEYDLDEARIRLSSFNVELKDVRPISSTAVKLFWEIQGSQEFVEGFYIRYRDMSSGGTAQKYNMVTVLNAGSSNHLLTDLRKFTKYEFFLVPYYKNVEGKPSNTRIVQTFEDVPSAPPENVNVKVVNLTSAAIEWSPPAPQHRNGILLGYVIHILGNITTLHSNLTLNSSITSITLHNLTTGAVYSVRALAFTAIGSGPLSSPIALRMDPNLLYSKQDGPSTNSIDATYLEGVVNQTWFYIVVIIILIVFIVSVIAIVVIMKRRIAWKKAISAHLTVPLHKNEEVGRGGFNGNAREALWINHGWRPTDKDNNQTKLMNSCPQNDINNGYSSAFVAEYSAPDYAEVDTHNLSTFYKKESSYPSSVPAPYATTTLINAVSQSKHGSVREHKSSGSEEMGSRKSEKPMPFDFNDDGAMEHLLAEQQAKSPSDSGSYTTDEYGMPVRKNINIKHHNKHRQQNTSFRPNPIILNGGSSVSGSQGSKAPIVNWTDLIPPPPENPPSECGTPPDTPILNCSVRGHNPNKLIRVQLPPMAYIHSGGSGSGRSPLITRSYQASPANSRHSLSSPRSTLSRNKKVADMSSADGSPHPQQLNRTQLPQFLQRLKPNQTPNNISHYAPSNATPHIITNPLMDRAIQSSLSSLVDETQQPTNKNQVIVGSYQRLDVDSDAERGRDMKTKNSRHSPPSSIGDTTDYAHCDRDGSNSGTSHQSSDAEDHESSFYAESDLANCIARAAQNAGFTFNEQSFVIEPQSQSQMASNNNKKFRHHQRAQLPNFRPTSPYSTDSNMSTAVPQHSRHPPKFRKRQGSDRTSNNQLASPSSCSEHSPSYDMIQSDFNNHLQQKQIKVPNAMHNKTNSHDSSNYPSYNKPIFQTNNKTIVNNDKNQSTSLSPSSSKDSFNLRAFALRLDARDTPIV